MKKSIFFNNLNFLLFIIASLLFNCKGKQGDPGPSGSSLSGTISGMVTLINSDGSQPLDKSGVVVKTNRGDSIITAANGSWSLNENSGVYNISFSKSGYGTSKINSNYAGGGPVYGSAVYLSQVPTYSAIIRHSVFPDKDTTSSTTGKDSSFNKDGYVYVNFSIKAFSTSLFERNFIIFYSNSNLSVSSNPSTYSGISNISVPASDTLVRAAISVSTLNNAGIKSGDPLYVIVYPSSAAPSESSKYVDPTSGKNIYTSLGMPSNVFTYTVPQ